MVQGALQRTLQEITIGHVQGQRRRTRQDDELGMHELDLQYQLPIKGTATVVPAFAEIDLNFEHEFHSAPGQRDSDLEVPHMTFGSYLDTGGPLVISACVVGYAVNDDNGGITGARVGVGAHGGNTVAAVPFSGAVHVTFQGWAVTRDDLSDNELDT